MTKTNSLNVLAQIINNNFFLWKDKDKIWCGLAQITINKAKGVLAQITKKQIFFYEMTRTKIWCGLAQITINKGIGVLAQITRNY